MPSGTSRLRSYGLPRPATALQPDTNPGPLARPAGEMMASLYRAFVENDCSLAEINPLAVTDYGRLLALDAKLDFDDNALYRHPEVVAMRDTAEEAPLEVKTSRHGITYIKLDGNIGCMVNGAGLAMATMDVIKLAGGEPANFLDVGGGASASQVSNALKILKADAQVRAVLINIFGGITRCDVAAHGIQEAAKRLKIEAPVVIRPAGTRVKAWTCWPPQASPSRWPPIWPTAHAKR